MTLKVLSRKVAIRYGIILRHLKSKEDACRIVLDLDDFPAKVADELDALSVSQEKRVMRKAWRIANNLED